MPSARVNVTIPEKLKNFIHDRVNTGEYSTPSDYVRTLIRDDQRRVVEQVNNLIQDGLKSGLSERSPAEIFSATRSELDKAGQNAKSGT